MNPRRLILRCRMCDPDGVLVEPTSGAAVTSAVDHALDEHRAELLGDPDTALAAVSVAA